MRENMRIAESELIINGDGSAFHIHIKPEELADIVILAGDPGRVELISSRFGSIEAKGASREFHWATGSFRGKRMTALSTGIGTDNIDIVMTELDALANVDFRTREPKPEHKSLTILRIGTTGAIQPDIPLGSPIFSCYSIGCDGLLNWYRGRDEVCDLKMEAAFKAHTNWEGKLPAPYFVKNSAKLAELFKGQAVKGVTISASGFYGPQGRVVRLGLAMPDMLDRFESFRYGDWRVTNFEMESSAVAGLGALLGHEAGTICCAIANRHLQSSNPDYRPYVEALIDLALGRLASL